MADAERPTRGIRRVLVVAAVAVLAFGGAIVALGDDARRGCVVDAPLDPTYQAQLLGEMTLEKLQQEIAITRDGMPVTGAKVCAKVFMIGMEAMGSSDGAAEEIAPGVYMVAITFLMSGGWAGDILITEEGREPASIHLEFDVA